MRVALGDVSLTLPRGFEHEITVVSRAPATNGYHANVRITAKNGAAGVTLEGLGDEYASRLGEGVGGAVEQVRNAIRRVGKVDALELGFRVTMPNGETVVHQVMLVVQNELVLTLATSRKDEDQDASNGLVATLASLQVS